MTAPTLAGPVLQRTDGTSPDGTARHERTVAGRQALITRGALVALGRINSKVRRSHACQQRTTDLTQQGA